MKLKIAHFYPGLRYNSTVMHPDILHSTQTQARLTTASEILGKNTTAFCQHRKPFLSIKECFVLSVATSVAVGEYAVTQFGSPNLIVGSSLGHYAGLVMAKALSFRQTVETVGNNGSIIDKHFADMNTLLIKGLQMAPITRLATKLKLPFMPVEQADGIALLVPRNKTEVICKIIRRHGYSVETTPLRPPFHTSAMELAAKALQTNISALSVSKPQIPFLSTYYADYVTKTCMIKEALAQEMHQPHLISDTNRKVGQAKCTTKIGIFAYGSKKHHQRLSQIL